MPANTWWHPAVATGFLILTRVIAADGPSVSLRKAARDIQREVCLELVLAQHR